jgi:hypothetical protein
MANLFTEVPGLLIYLCTYPGCLPLFLQSMLSPPEAHLGDGAFGIVDRRSIASAVKQVREGPQPPPAALLPPTHRASALTWS